jgi:hypothetical protein
LLLLELAEKKAKTIHKHQISRMDLRPNLDLDKICDRFVAITTRFTQKNGTWKSTKLAFLILNNIGEHECLL